LSPVFEFTPVFEFPPVYEFPPVLTGGEGGNSYHFIY
jgi:hypothetical protein